MSSEIKIPAVGESITSGIIAEWLKPDGSNVAEGDPILTLETDKVSTELAADTAGRLEVTVPAGEEVSIGAVVGRIHELPAGAEMAGTPAPAPAPEAGGDTTPEPEPDPDPERAPEERPAERVPQLEVVPSTAPQPEGKPSPGGGGAGGSPASRPPAARRGEPADAGGAGRTTRKKMSPLRRKIAAHLVDAQRNAAILTTFNECDMSAVMALRKEIQESFVARHGIKLGFMSFFVKAVVQALRDVPQVNARVDGDEIVTNHFYDVGVAIGTERGLIVPVVRDAGSKSFAELEREIVEFADRARSNKITIEDLQGGVFTISNGGVYGSLLSTPILNPPQSGILGMHTIQQRPVAVGGEVVVRPMMYLALSYDHRIVDGREAVTFLIRVKECIERPERLLVEA